MFHLIQYLLVIGYDIKANRFHFFNFAIHLIILSGKSKLGCDVLPCHFAFELLDVQISLLSLISKSGQKVLPFPR